MAWRRDPDDFADEVQAHLELEAARLRAEGRSPEEARREAVKAFGNPALAIEAVQGARRWRMLTGVWTDLRYALRLGRRGPGFTATAILVLSLGIGVNTALFSIVNALFFKPLPVERPEELVYFYTIHESGQVLPSISDGYFSTLFAHAPDTLEFSSHWRVTQAVNVGDETIRPTGYWVHPNYAQLLGAAPHIGRWLETGDDLSNPMNAMVISHAFWVEQFDADPGVIGRKVRIESRFFHIVGVMPEGFVGLSSPLEPADYWTTTTQGAGHPYGNELSNGPIARMTSGMTFTQTQAFLAAQVPKMREAAKRRLDQIEDLARRERIERTYDNTRFEVQRAVDIVDPFEPGDQLVPRAMLAGLTSIVVLVLLIATANIAGLLLARGVTRTGELAVRRALGAGGLRLGRQLLIESVLLSTAGGVLGLALAWNLVDLFQRTTPDRLAFDVALDWRVLGFAAAACLVTGVMVGLAPALQALKVNVLEALGSGIVGSRTAGGHIRRWIVVPQITLSLVLLLVAAVHVRSLFDIEHTSPGYQTSEGLVVQIGRWEPGPHPLINPMPGIDRQQWKEDEARRVREFNRNVLDRVNALPNVTKAAIVAGLPMRSSLSQLASVMTKSDYDTGGKTVAGAWRSVVSHDYFDVMSMTLLAGRPFDDRDSLYRPKVALVSASLQLELGRNLIGESIGFTETQQGREVEWLEVVGVVNDVMPVLQDQAARPRVYVPLLQQWRGASRNLVVHGAGDPDTLARDVRQAVIGSDAYGEVYGIQSMTEVVGEILYPRRVAAGILATAGLIGLALASIGLYGVVSFSVARRRREMGIRATLGASRRDLFGLILREGIIVALFGCATGLVLGYLALRLTTNIVPDIPVVDAVAYVGVPVLLTMVVLAACYLPARRASRVDPAEVLRSL